MDTQTVDGIAVVAAPDLRRIVKHTAVEPAAAPAAALNKDLGKVLTQTLQHIIYT